MSCMCEYVDLFVCTVTTTRRQIPQGYGDNSCSDCKTKKPHQTLEGESRSGTRFFFFTMSRGLTLKIENKLKESSVFCNFPRIINVNSLKGHGANNIIKSQRIDSEQLCDNLLNAYCQRMCLKMCCFCFCGKQTDQHQSKLMSE